MADTISPHVETIAEIPKITELVVFGDSLSDTLNTYQATNGNIPVSPPNFEGRFSNGPIWVDQILPELGLTSNSLFNFAYGGAETGVNTVTPGIPGLTEQVALFEASLNSHPVDPNALYTILIAGNDLINLPSENTIATAITNISTAITDLVNLGAENIVVLNLLDLGLLPKNIDAGTSTIATGLATAFNTGLNTTLTTLETTLNLDLHLVDLFGLNQAIGANPNDFAFTQPINVNR
jgi:phospholipase/lecithinase/hemolysin